MDDISQGIEIQALQALKLLPDALLEAKGGYQRTAGILGNSNSGGVVRNEDGLPQVTRALFQIRKLAEETRIEAREDQPDIRKKDLRKAIEAVENHSRELAKAMSVPYVADWLLREGELKRGEVTVSMGREEEPLARLVQEIVVLADTAKSSLERKIIQWDKEGIHYGRPELDDLGGSSTAKTLDRLPLKQFFVFRALCIFGKYCPGVASTAKSGPFALFARLVWNLATEEETELESPIKDVFKELYPETEMLSPLLLSLRLDLPEGTLPPIKSTK